MARQPQAVNLIVSCTQAKREDPVVTARQPGLDLALPVHERVALWASQLNAADGEGVLVRDLYYGHHWSVALDLCDAPTPPEIRLWVASAGYGLLGVEDRVHPYGATFRCGETDSVLASLSEGTEWWSELSHRVRLPNGQAPRTIEQIVQGSPEAALVIAASRNYLSALERDFVAAVGHMDNRELAVVVSTGTSGQASLLDEASVQFDGRFKQVVGGGMLDLNVRVARYLIRELGFPAQSRDAVQAAISRECEALPPLERFDRERYEDLAVVEFIREELYRDPTCKKSPLLRKWRDGKNACEQKRFGRLFESVKEELNA